MEKTENFVCETDKLIVSHTEFFDISIRAPLHELKLLACRLKPCNDPNYVGPALPESKFIADLLHELHKIVEEFDR